MEELTRADYVKLMECTSRLYRWDGRQAFSRHVAEVMGELIAGGVAAYQTFDFRENRTELALSAAEEEIAGNAAAFYTYIDEHPLISSTRRRNGGRVRRISDVMAWTAFQKTGLFNEFYRKVGLGHQMAAELPARPGDVAGVAYSRELGGADFSAREVEMLRVMRLHVMQAGQIARRVNALSARVREMRGMLEAVDEGVVALDAQLKVRTRTRRAAEMLERHFGAGRRGALPEVLKRWAVMQMKGAPLTGRPWNAGTLKTAAGEVRVHLAWREGGWVMLLDEPKVVGEGLSAARLERLGLTGSEAEVLLWISRGKTNPEIAIIVGSRPRTVQKHVERVLRKLGVENRQAAMLRALEVAG